ncbi:MAG TPA: SRPBCC family protein [Steroidobacteraceae bacterium]|nr:SRPBCC family protein [Steroidobacteraceae bacterium]
MTPIARSLTGVALGAAAMFWLDPRSGRRRRAVFLDRLGSATTDFNEAVGIAARDVKHRARGVRSRLTSLFRHEEVPDDVLAERVRAALGRAVSHPGAITVAVTQGRVTLMGSVLAEEHDELVDTVWSVRGVGDVADELAVHESARGVPELQGGRHRGRARFPLLRENWSPAVRLGMGTAGGALAAWGTRQLFSTRGSGLLGGAELAVGSALILRSVTNAPLRRLAGGAGRRAIDVRKTIQVEAPVERVYETLADFERYPSFMRNVMSVRNVGDGRLHWVVAGPAGTSVEWDSELTMCRPNEVLAWRTVRSGPVAHAGTIRCERAGDATRLDVRMSYNPPGGVLGHSVARLFGVDPKRQLDEDLLRLKTFIETGMTPHDAAARSAARAGRDRLSDQPQGVSTRQ